MKNLKYWFLILILTLFMACLVPFGAQAQEPKSITTPVEIVNLRTEDSKTYDLGNGYRQLVLNSAPIHYKDDYTNPYEQWKDIDLTIKDGDLLTAPYYLFIDGLTITVRDKRTDALVILTLSKVGISTADISKTPYIFKDNSAFIKDFALDTDLEIVATNEGVKFTRILKTDKAPLSAEFQIFSLGTGLQITSEAVDAEGTPLEVTTSKSSGTVTETILSSELGKVVYPIRIDPSITIQPSTIDTFLKKEAPTTNYGTWNKVELACDQTNTYTHRALLSFNISTIDPTWVVTNSTMILYYFANLAIDPVGRTVWAYKNTRSDWVETQATWVDYKTATNWTAAGGDYVTTAPVGGSSVVPAAYGYQSWNITAIVQDARDTALPLVHILLKDNTEDSTPASDRQWQYRSREFGPTPQLVVTYLVAPTVVTEAAYDISYISAHLAGNVTSTGSENVDQRGFDWDIDSGAPYANSWIAGGSYGPGPYDCDTQVFPACTKIYFRAKAANSAGWAYGDEGNFTTLCYAAPTVNTIGSSDMTCDYANIYGNITDLGGIAADTWGFDWGTAPGVYTDGFSISLGGYGNGTYGTSIYPADYNTTYYFRFYAIGPGGRGNGTEMSFTTPWCPPQCPTNMTVTQTGGDSVLITWTTGLYATNTTIVGKEGSPPTDQFDGWQTFFGNATSVTRTGLNLGMVEYFYLGFSSNPAGNSTCINAVSIGGSNMLLFGFLGFFGMAIVMTYLTSRFRGVFWSIFSALIWFALATWIASGTITHMDPGDLAEPWALILMVLFFGASIAVLAMFMDQENKYEMRTKKGSVSWSASGPRPLSGKKNYNDAYYNRRAELHEKLQPKRRR